MELIFEKAKKILEKEGCFYIKKEANLDFRRSVITPDWEKLCVREACVVLGRLGYQVYYKSDSSPDERRVALQNENNPALKESAKLFNDALLDEQAKQIKEIKKQNKLLGEVIASRNTEIWELQEKVKKMAKMGKQISRLNEVIGKRNASIKHLKTDLEEKEDLLECYRFSDKNKEDMISGLKKLCEKYRHQLAAAAVNKVNKQALKSAESALVYKDYFIDKLKKELKIARANQKK